MQINTSNSNLKYIIIRTNKNKFAIIFILSIILIFISLLTYFITKYMSKKNEMISKNLVSNYNIKTLYNNSISYSSANDIEKNNNNNPFVIGLIEIDKINLIYPILSTFDNELLKLSPCRFAGPMPNQKGNLCIAGHNYVDNKQFSKLNELEINDTIKIYDLEGLCINYSIYQKNEIKPDDLSCINQNTNNETIITLITCNNVSGNRLCIKAIKQK